MQGSHLEQYFSLFLTNPVLAYVRLSGCDATAELLQTLDAHIGKAMQTQRASLGSHAAGQSSSDPWHAVLADVFVSRIVLRFALCRATLLWLAEHEAGKVSVTGKLQAVPELPEQLAPEEPQLVQHVAAIWSVIQEHSANAL